MMKKTSLLAATLLLLVTIFSACKKDDETTKPLREKMIGKWRVEKIDVTTYTNESSPTTVSTSYSSSAYMDFKDNQSDDFELGLGSTTNIGTFNTSITDALFLEFSNKRFDGKVTKVTDNELQFTGTIAGTNPKVMETYFLKR